MANSTEIHPDVVSRLRLLTADQVCDLLQVQKEWLWDHCQAGKFPHVKIGRQTRFRPADVEAYIDGTWTP